MFFPCSLTIEDNCHGMRADRALAMLLPGFSREAIKRAILNGGILRNNAAFRPNQPLFTGDAITILKVELPETGDTLPQAEAIPLDVLYEDPAMLVINKPAGMVVHPGAGNTTGTLVSALLYREGEEFAAMGQEEDSDASRPGIVHRLDKDTSGLVVVARNGEMRRQLQSAFKSRQVSKLYLTVVHGSFSQPQGTVELPIGRNPDNRLKMAIVSEEDGGRAALTRYKVLAQKSDLSLLLVRIYTGRTHQIRVHLSHLGHPVAGDILYGGRCKGKCPLHPSRQLLHAWQLSLPHPATQQQLQFAAPLPQDLAEAVEFFGATAIIRQLSSDNHNSPA